MKNFKLGLGGLVVTVLVVSAFSTANAGEVRERVVIQEHRINQGVDSGKISLVQAGHLQKLDAAINKERLTDIKANGGTLTVAEGAKLNVQLNQVSAKIYADKNP